MIDNLTYTYGDAARPDRLTNVVDAADAAKGFKYTAGAADYQYDLSGNLTQDNHKGFAFGYNYLNLPQSMTKGADVITMTYTADGEKLTKALTGGGATKSYVSGIEYSGTNLEAIYFSDGRCTPNGTSAFYYEYTVKDHLGNARVSFQANGASLTPLQENHYYPFGLEMEGSWIAQVRTENPYQYNGKELNEDFGLNLSDYGARWYDASLGRWWSVDPLGEKSPNISTYAYVLNNPLILIDPTGMEHEAYGSIGNQTKNIEQIDERKIELANTQNGQPTVHVLVLNGADKAVVDAAIKTLENSAAAAGINVAFRKTNPKSFDITKMSKTDAVAVVGGSNKETANYILNNFDRGYMSQKFQDDMNAFANSNPLENPEKSDAGDQGWGYVIATTTNLGKVTVREGDVTRIGSAANRLGVKTASDALALTIFHGMGHTAGLGHPKNDFGIMETQLNGSLSRYMGNFSGDVAKAATHTMSSYPDIKRAFINRFGSQNSPGP